MCTRPVKLEFNEWLSWPEKQRVDETNKALRVHIPRYPELNSVKRDWIVKQYVMYRIFQTVDYRSIVIYTHEDKIRDLNVTVEELETIAIAVVLEAVKTGDPSDKRALKSHRNKSEYKISVDEVKSCVIITLIN